ncbi:hypothetical protein DPMN_040957 [Dreissena polymorpha]|uniref:Uncharacterized protein n=1 Tax=Dreissena polymorpha TaxID=45954 RepID=A0A9D4CW10_DREPO|nr:hypothetical protein DPMN_040957 [Dreissena polymorpha]
MAAPITSEPRTHDTTYTENDVTGGGAWERTGEGADLGGGPRHLESDWHPMRHAVAKFHRLVKS